MPVMAPRTEAEAFYYPNYNRCMENAEKERKADQRKSLLKRFGISPEEATIEKLWEIIFILADEADLGKESRRMIAEITSELEQLEDGMVSKKQRFIQYLKKILIPTRTFSHLRNKRLICYQFKIRQFKRFILHQFIFSFILILD